MRVPDPRSSAPGRLANVSAALLLGGPSAKFGSDKADVAFAGTSLAAHAANQLATLFEDVLIVGGPKRPSLPGRHVEDPVGPQCPLRGIVAALEAARETRVLIVAVDLPLLPPDLVLALTAWPEAELVAPRRNGRIEGLCAIYSRDRVLPPAREQLHAKRLELRDLLAGLEGSFLEHDDLRALDPDDRAFLKVDTPAGLARATALRCD